MKSILNKLFGSGSSGEVKPLKPPPQPPVIAAQSREEEAPKTKEKSPDKKKKIQEILNVFETGKAEGDYSNVSIFHDAPGEVRQITFGRSQTTQHSHLHELMQDYIVASGKYADLFKGINFKDYSLVNNKTLIANLKLSGSDPIMREVQDRFFDRRYWEPAIKWAKNNGITSPIGQLVIYDSFIHSGGIPSYLRNRFPERTPTNGGNEVEWLRAYLKTRHNWLKNHSRKILNKTIYRTSAMINHLEKGDYNLDSPFFANGVWVP